MININFSLLMLIIDPIPQPAGTFKRKDLLGCRHHGVTGSRIPAFAFPFMIDTEFSESTNHYILIGFQCAFDDFK
jgi:hypothetical protein